MAKRKREGSRESSGGEREKMRRKGTWPVTVIKLGPT